MAINDELPDVEPEVPEAEMKMPKPIPVKNEPSDEQEDLLGVHAELAVRANNFLSGQPTVFQHQNAVRPGEQQGQATDQRFESTKVEKSKRGQVKDPKHDHRLKQNKDTEDDPSEHVETEREREARQREEANDKRREDEEIQRAKEEEKRKRLQEQEAAKVTRLQNTPWGEHKTHFQPLSKGADAKLNEILFHEAYGPEIRREMGMTASLHGLDKVRFMLHSKISAAQDIDTRNELIALNSKVANLLIESGFFKKN